MNMLLSNVPGIPSLYGVIRCKTTLIIIHRDKCAHTCYRKKIYSVVLLYRELSSFPAQSPLLQSHWSDASPMLVSQLLTFNLIHNSNCHILVQIPLSMAGSADPALSSTQTSYFPVRRPIPGPLPANRKDHWIFLTPSHIERATREHRINPTVSRLLALVQLSMRADLPRI